MAVAQVAGHNHRAAAVRSRKAADSYDPAMVAGAAAEALRENGGADREEGCWVDFSLLLVR